MEGLIEYLNKVVNGLKIIKIVVIHINTDTEIQPSVASVNNLEVPEFNKVGMFGISYCHN